MDLTAQTVRQNQRISDLVAENVALNNRVLALVNRAGESLDDIEYWKRKYREADQELERVKRKFTVDKS
jgi:hypothetical protein